MFLMVVEQSIRPHVADLGQDWQGVVNFNCMVLSFEVKRGKGCSLKLQRPRVVTTDI